MPQTIEFNGQTHEFPDNFNQEQISQALSSTMDAEPSAKHTSTPDTSSALRTERVNVGARENYGLGESNLLPELPTLNDKQSGYIDRIGEIETGGLEDRFVRTQVKPQSGGAGSSAYGPYQITHGLLEGTVEQSPQMFGPEELQAAQELMERQEIALAVGGRDRNKYQKGGAKHGMANRWAKQYGYETVEDFLNAFDYGGDLGLSDDGDFQVLYESFARKMLTQNLKDAGGDELEAASRWHGGSNWNKGKHKGTTEQYRKKYQKLAGE